jgi:hypothetical protein
MEDSVLSTSSRQETWNTIVHGLGCPWVMNGRFRDHGRGAGLRQQMGLEVDINYFT